MSKRKTKPKFIDPAAFLHQPHDKYARFVLQIKAVVQELIEYCVPHPIQENLDLNSLELSKDSFVDANLRNHFSDICYQAKRKDRSDCRISFLIEHKSELPDHPVYFQLLRYVTNVWSKEIKQGQSPGPIIPIVIYHGTPPFPKHKLTHLFPGLTDDMEPYIPTFEYILLDIAQIPDEQLEDLQFLLLRNIFLALKHSRNEEYVDHYWQKIVIFAPSVLKKSVFRSLVLATILYMDNSSKTFHKKLKHLDAAMTPTEGQYIQSYLYELSESSRQEGLKRGFEKGVEEGFEKGVEEGFEKGVEEGQFMVLKTQIKAYLQKFPNAQNEEIMDLFQTDLKMLETIRNSLK